MSFSRSLNLLRKRFSITNPLQKHWPNSTRGNSMGANSSKRRRQEATPIDLDAMFDDSSLNGLESAIRLMFDPDALPPVGTRSDTAPPIIVETPATPTLRKPPSLEVNMSTDDKSPMSTVDICNLSTVDNNSYQQSNKGVDSEELEQLSTVDISADFRLTPAKAADVSSVDAFNMSTDDKSPMSTVDIYNL